jgi:hypothetical protein
MFGSTLTKFLKLDNLLDNLTGYVESKVELLKIELKQDLASGLSKAIAYLIIAFVFAMVLLFLSLGVAVVLAEQVGALGGYGIVGGFYLLIGIGLFIKKESLILNLEKKLTENFKKKK